MASPKAWLVCFSAALFFFYEFIQMHMFDAINESLRQAFSVNATELSFLSSTYLWADLLFLLPAGIILDRYSVRRTIVFALWICIIGTLGFAVSYSFWWAAFFHFLSGIGNAFCFLSCMILVSRWFPPNRQAMVVGLVVTMAFLGGMAAQSPLAHLAQYFGWRYALMLDAFLGVLILLQITYFVEDSPKAKWMNGLSSHSSLKSELKLVLSNRQNWLCGLYTCLLNLPIMVLCALWGKAYLSEVHHLLEFEATNVISVVFLGAIFGAPMAGWVSDHWGYRRRPMLLGAMASLVVMVLLLALPQLSYTSLLLIFFTIGFVTSTQVISYPMVAESNAQVLTGTATGLASLIIMGGAGLAQVLFGQLLDWHWQGTMKAGQRLYLAGDYHFAMLLFPISLIIAFVAISFSKETHCQRFKGAHDE